MKTHMRIFLTLAVLALGVATGVATSGCSRITPERREARPSPEATWGRTLRPPATPGQKYFFNERSRQIEESLGL
jgi:hypothetical protein